MRTEHVVRPRSRHRTCPAGRQRLLALLVAAGCADDRPPLAAPPETRAQAGGSALNLQDPLNLFTAEVSASGEGCAPGSWRAAIAPDGQVFTVGFDGLFAQIGPAQTSMRRDCSVEFKLRSPSNRSFAVRGFGYTGRADMDAGISAVQTATFMFDGTRRNANAHLTRIAGPFDGPYTNFEDVPASAQAWSPCGLEHDLSTLTVLRIDRDAASGRGFINMSGGVQDGLVIDVVSRACVVTPPVQPAPLPSPEHVTLQPATVQVGQPFRIGWQPLPNHPDALYVAQISAVTSAPGPATVVWASPPIVGTSLVYDGPPLTMQSVSNVFLVEVLARVGGDVSRSAPVALTVLNPTVPAPTTVPPATAVSPPASLPAVPALPAWASPLVGSYAVRTDTFSTTALGTMLSDRQLALADFVQVGDGLELRTRLCAKRSSSLASTVTLRNPEAYPEIRQRVALDNGRWRTVGAPVAVGFDREGHPRCDGRAGQRVPKRPEQTWIRGTTCQCPDSLEDEPSDDDCRVTDPDRDGNPGLGFAWSGVGGGDGQVSHAAATQRGFYVRGRVDPAGSHVAAVRADEVTFQLACEPDACSVPVNTRPCTSEHNTALFRRLGAPAGGVWTCAMLREQRASIFPGGSPQAPSRCTPDSVNEEP